MIVRVKAIVLRSIKFQDTGLIVKCYTEQGVKSYLIRGAFGSKKGKFKIGYFQLLNLLEIEANHNDKGHLNSIREVKIDYAYNSISTDVLKQSIVMFLAEVLNLALQEEEANLSLFNFLEYSLQKLDKQNDISNFHLIFLLNLSKYLGFYPQLKNQEYPYFDLQEGLFQSHNTLTAIQNKELVLFKKLLNTPFDNMIQLTLNKTERQSLLNIMINYFELHLSGFRKLNTLPVLQAIFN
jgi:DNA repair protein RecO (recombination protein O)